MTLWMLPLDSSLSEIIMTKLFYCPDIVFNCALCLFHIQDGATLADYLLDTASLIYKVYALIMIAAFLAIDDKVIQLEVEAYTF